MSQFSKEDPGGTKLGDVDTITIKTNSIILSLEGKKKRNGRKHRNWIALVYVVFLILISFLEK